MSAFESLSISLGDGDIPRATKTKMQSMKNEGMGFQRLIELVQVCLEKPASETNPSQLPLRQCGTTRREGFHFFFDFTATGELFR